VNDEAGFIFDLPYEYLKPALLVSLLSVWVLVGLFSYLNRYTRRRYFTIWTAAWLFYALWLTLCISFPEQTHNRWLAMMKQWCVGTSATFLLWGATRFLKLRARQRLFGLFIGFLGVWSYLASFQLNSAFWLQLPVFSMMAFASGLSGWCFFRLEQRHQWLGAGLLAVGFFLWGVYLASFPFLQLSGSLISSAYFISAVLQLFIAVSMIVLVLEEVRLASRLNLERFQSQKSESELLRTRVQSTEERYRSLFDQASEGILIARADDLEIVETNQTARRLLGLDGADSGQIFSAFCGINAEHEKAPENGRAWFDLIQRRRQFNLVRRDGGATPVEVDGAPISFQGNPAFQFFIREMTEKSRLEQQLRQAEKLSALGKMISGIAHELNNPLAVVKGYLELILSRHELPAQTRTDLEKVAHESNRAVKLVTNFLSFAREQPVHREAVDFNELIRRVVDLRTFELQSSGIELRLNLRSDLAVTQADPDQFQQVIVNLLNNSMHALAKMPPPRRISITTSQKDGTLCISVEDNGPGVPSEIVPHIFEPFFTTKEVGTGTGLGLSIAHSIMSDHQGRIYYQTSAEGGAGFVLELPVGHAAANPAPAPQPEPWRSGGEKTKTRGIKILVLDDERSLAELLGEILGILGYETFLCNSALQALELIEQHHFDLILSDYRMPVMDGQKFFQTATQRHPELARRIIFLTGDVVNEETQSFLESTGNPHLRKPFQMANVERIISEVLEAQTL